MRRLDIIFRIVSTTMRHAWGEIVPLFSAMGSRGKGGASMLTIVGLVGISLITLGALIACPSEDDGGSDPAPMIDSVSAADTDEGSGSSVTITLDLALPSSVSGASISYDLAGDATGGATAADVADFSGASLTGLTATATIGSNRAVLTFATVATLNDDDGNEQARVTVTGIAFTPTGEAENISGATENNSDAFTITPAPPPMPTISSVSAADTGEGSGSSVTITLDLALPSSVGGASISYGLAGDATGGATAADVDDFSGVSLTGLTATATIGSNRARLTFTTVATLNDGDDDERARVTVTGIAFTPTGQAENIIGATENNSGAFTITPAPPAMPTISSVSAADTDEGSGSPVTITLDLALPSSVSGASISYNLAGDATGGATAADVDDFSGASLMGLTETATIGSNRAELTFTTVATLNDGDGDEQARVTVTGIAFTPAGQAENISGATENNSDAFTIGEIPPVFSGAPYGFGIAEGDHSAGSPGAVGTVSATPATRYAISAGNIGTRFAIDPASGTLTAVGALDFETTPSYTLTVTAHNGADANAPSATATVEITVTDIQTGMADEPWHIDSVTELQSIDDPDGDDNGFANDYTTANTITLTRAQSLAAHYLLTADLDFDTDGSDTVDSSDTIANFDPIGDSSNFFGGRFDGDGRSITNLTIDSNLRNRVGLFAAIGTGSVVRDLNLIEVNIMSTTANSGSGALVGSNDGVVENCSASGTVNGANNTGGLIGSISQGILRNSFATVSVSGGIGAGGLVGNDNGGEIMNSYATGAVMTGAVVGNLGSAGLVSNVSNNGVLERSYALGSVTNVILSSPMDSSEFIAGLVSGNRATVTNSYWNLDAAQTVGSTPRATADKLGVHTNSGTATGVIGFTEAQLKMPTAPDTMIGSPLMTIYNGWSTMDWDFGANSQFPSLRRFTFTDNNGNGIFDTGDVQTQGELICGQPAGHVQCP